MLNRKNIIIGIICILAGSLITYALTRTEIQSQRKLTARILTTAVQSMEISQSLAESCSDAYNTATSCVSNLKTCNLEEEAKKLDLFNARRKNADQQIDRMNEDIKKIIEDVSANR